MSCANYLTDVSALCQVAVVWRSDDRQVHYDWLTDGWAAGEGEENSLSKQRLTELIQESLRSRDVLPYSMEMMADLIDENRGVRRERVQ